MKALVLASTLFAAAPLSPALAFHYDCVDQKVGDTQLEFHTIVAEGPNNLEAALTKGGSQIGLSGRSELDPAVNGYHLTDSAGNEALLRFFVVRPISLARCGRGDCDFDGTPQTKAVLQYLGNATDFACH